jgi:ABC-type nitrate/sulfonate/bicarbonate transport system substrate-binding protein
MEVINIAGVPEHFNYPWRSAIRKNLFEEHNIKLEWETAFAGTGAMAQGLQENKLDLAIILTEGVVKSIADGNTAKIIAPYVNSSLIWGIHIPADHDIVNETEIFDHTYAISRKGSGSHLMAILHALEHDKPEPHFSTVHSLDGAREAFRNNEAQVFFWEKYTTQPFVDKGEMQRVGEYPTPWPCFVLAASEKALNSKSEQLNKIVDIIYQEIRNLLKEGEKEIISTIATEYDLSAGQVKSWFSELEWATQRDPAQLKRNISEVQQKLVEAQLIKTADLSRPFVG